MKTKTLWLVWLYLFLFCCIIGFIPQPTGFVKVLMILIGIAFFVPGALLLRQGGQKTRKWVKLISVLSLVLTTLGIILNFTSVLMAPVWGGVFYILMGIVSTPMLCTQIWALSLFGWACLLTAGLFIKK